MAGEKKIVPGKDAHSGDEDELSAGHHAHLADTYDISPCDHADYIEKEVLEMKRLFNKRGMEMVQVAILVAIAVALGLIFKSQITDFVNDTFSSLNKARF